MNSFDISVGNFTKRITYFKDENEKSEKNEDIKTLTTKLKSIDIFVIFVKTSTSITLSVTGSDLIVLRFINESIMSIDN